MTLDLTTLRTTSLSKHNDYRKLHTSPLMTISDSLNSTAQTWAEYLAANTLFQHRMVLSIMLSM
jgi:uncharacterized protein YkwD